VQHIADHDQMFVSLFLHVSHLRLGPVTRLVYQRLHLLDLVHRQRLRVGEEEGLQKGRSYRELFHIGIICYNEAIVAG